MKTRDRAIRAPFPGTGLPHLLAAVWRWSAACAQRRRQRLALAELDERLLGDIGLTRADSARETEKYPWMR